MVDGFLVFFYCIFLVFFYHIHVFDICVILELILILCYFEEKKYFDFDSMNNLIE